MSKVREYGRRIWRISPLCTIKVRNLRNFVKRKKLRKFWSKMLPSNPKCFPSSARGFKILCMGVKGRIMHYFALYTAGRNRFRLNCSLKHCNFLFKRTKIVQNVVQNVTKQSPLFLETLHGSEGWNYALVFLVHSGKEQFNGKMFPKTYNISYLVRGFIAENQSILSEQILLWFPCNWASPAAVIWLPPGGLEERMGRHPSGSHLLHIFNIR